MSFEPRKATAWRRACMSPRRPRVIICSAIGLTAFAFVTVVLMRSCSISSAVRFAYSARRWDESLPSFLPVRWCRTSRLLNRVSLQLGRAGAAVVTAKPQPVLAERLLYLLDRLLAEVRDRGELVLGLRHEVADRLDADALEAVVRADAELELLDREVLHAVRERLGRAGAVGRRRRGLAEALDLLDVGEDRELADEDLGR